jgi:hypothetical protein
MSAKPLLQVRVTVTETKGDRNVVGMASVGTKKREWARGRGRDEVDRFF